MFDTITLTLEALSMRQSLKTKGWSLLPSRRESSHSPARLRRSDNSIQPSGQPQSTNSAADGSVNAIGISAPSAPGTPLVQAGVPTAPSLEGAHIGNSQSQANAPIPQTEPLSVSQRLWNDAYNDLYTESDTQQLVKDYLKTVQEVLGGSASSTSTSGAFDLSNELRDPRQRQVHMRALVDQGQIKVARSSKITRGIGRAIKFVLWAKDIVDLAVQSNPTAALPWAGVCVGLQILLNPANATESHLNGIAHVISRMEWYCTLDEHILDNNNINIGDQTLPSVHQQLEKRIINLYKALLLYQMKSAVSCYRKSGLVFLRGLLNLDDWDGDLASITSAEKALIDDSNQHLKIQSRGFLKEFVDIARTQQALLGDIHQTLKDYMNLQKGLDVDSKDAACLRDLFIVDPQSDMERIEWKKDKLLDKAYDWILETRQYIEFSRWNDDSSEPHPCRLLWIKGHAGTGKTMLLIGIIRKLTGRPSVLAPHVSFFFCQGTENKALSCATAILRSLIWLLLLQQPHLRVHLRSRHQHQGLTLFTDRNAFFALSEVFKSMLSDDDFSRAYLLVDALDECNEGLEELLNLIIETITLTDKVKWLVSGRPEIDLKGRTDPKFLLELDAQLLQGPVQAYIDHKLSILRTRDGYDDDIVKDVTKEISQRAQNTFLWVALVFKELELTDGWCALEAVKNTPSGLSDLYKHMMSRIEAQKASDVQYCKSILAAAFLAYRPLSLSELMIVAGLPPKSNPGAFVAKCASFLTIQQHDYTIHLIHQSAKDYLQREQATNFQEEGAAQTHAIISKRSIQAMRALRRNIYGLPTLGSSPKAIKPAAADPLAPLKYSCVFWVHHIRKTKPSIFQLQELLADSFAMLKEHFLHWLEALSLVGKLIDGISCIRELLSLIPDANSEFGSFLKDAERFTISYRPIIEQTPLQIYAAALAFCPSKSEVKRIFWDQKDQIISTVTGISEEWDSCLQILEGHGSYVNAVAVSPDGKMLATGASDRTVRLWDGTIGTWQRKMEGHLGYVLSVAFSQDNKTVASSSSDKTIRLWDVSTGSHKITFHRPDTWINTIAFSPDDTTLAAGCVDTTIVLWSLATGEERMLTNHDGSVNAIAFSPVGDLLASGSADATVKLQNLLSGTVRTFNGHIQSVNATAFSPEGDMLASGSSDRTVRLWRLDTDDVQALTAHGDAVNAVAFSSRGDMLASASSDRTVRIWDTPSGACIATLDGHRSWVNDVAFASHDTTLVSASSDKTVRCWAVTVNARKEDLQGHSSSVNAVVFSQCGKILATASEDLTVKIWDGLSGRHKLTLIGHSGSILALNFTADGQMIASASTDKNVRIWDVITGDSKQILGGHNGHVLAVTFSPNSRILASAASDWRVRIWDVETGKLIQTLEGHQNWVDAVSFSNDGKFLASASKDRTIRLWSPALDKESLEKSGVSIRNLTFSPGGEILALVSNDTMERHWSGRTFAHSKTWKVGESSRQLSFSKDNRLISTGNETVNASGSVGDEPGLIATSVAEQPPAFRPHPITIPAIPDARDKEALWEYIKANVLKILCEGRGWADSKKFMYMYHAIFTFSTTWYPDGRRADEELYHRMSKFFGEYLEQLVADIKTSTGETLLTAYVREWSRLTEAAKYIDNMFRYVNRHAVRRMQEVGKEVYDVYSLLLLQWRNFVFETISHDLVNSVLKLIERQRNGALVEYGRIKHFIASLISLGGVSSLYVIPSPLYIYRQHFESPFLRATKLFYQSESEHWLAANDVSEFMKLAETR